MTEDKPEHAAAPSASGPSSGENCDLPTADPTATIKAAIGVNPQVALVLDTALQVWAMANRRQGRQVEIHRAEAQRLAELPYDLMYDIAEIAIKRVDARGDTHLQLSDIEAAYRILITKVGPQPWLTVLSTVGALLAGLGLQFLLTPLFFPGQQLSTKGLAVGLLLSLVGIASLSVGLALTFRRNP